MVVLRTIREIRASGKFIESTVSPFDWVGANVDNDGSERARAWKDGGANDICPVGKSP
jgi:hypothetical protein